jgi:hypothetical protein
MRKEFEILIATRQTICEAHAEAAKVVKLLIWECERHNSDYHHHTPESVLDAARKVSA